MYIFGKFEAFCKRLEKVTIMQSLRLPPRPAPTLSGYFILYGALLGITDLDLLSHY